MNMQKELISVIIPVYKHEKELGLALESIKKQTYTNVEVIIEKDELREGAPVMRNRGLEKAKGDYVIFWDADVVAEPEMLEKLKNILDNNSEVSFVYCNYYFGKKKMSARKFDAQELKKNNYIHSTSLIRKKDAVKWDESLKRFQDWDLWLVMFEQGKSGVLVNEYLFKIIAKGTISSWLPKCAYKKPWKYLPGIKSRVEKYYKAREGIVKKHHLI